MTDPARKDAKKQEDGVGKPNWDAVSHAVQMADRTVLESISQDYLTQLRYALRCGHEIDKLIASVVYHALAFQNDHGDYIVDADSQPVKLKDLCRFLGWSFQSCYPRRRLNYLVQLGRVREDEHGRISLPDRRTHLVFTSKPYSPGRGSVGILRPSVRFSIFNRDKFTCHYCGRKPPEVTLQVDHVKSRHRGGQDEESNLVTSCRECNIGKGSHNVA